MVKRYKVIYAENQSSLFDFLLCYRIPKLKIKKQIIVTSLYWFPVPIFAGGIHIRQVYCQTDLVRQQSKLTSTIINLEIKHQLSVLSVYNWNQVFLIIASTVDNN